MSQVVNLLEILWTYERMKESALLSDGEKDIIRKELFHSLPIPIYSTLSQATLGIISSHLDPQNLPSIIKDEEKPIEHRPRDREAILPKGRKTK